jgi:hypothetical protein
VTLFTGVESQLPSPGLENFYIDTDLLYTLHCYSLRRHRTQAQAGSQWSAELRASGPEDTSAHFPVSTVSSRPITPTPLRSASRATSIVISQGADAIQSVTSASLGPRTIPTTSSEAPHLGPSRSEASHVPTQSDTSQSISVHAYPQKDNSRVVTLPFSSAPAGAVPAYSGDITPYRIS